MDKFAREIETPGWVVGVSSTERHETLGAKPCCVMLKLTGKRPRSPVGTRGLRSVKLRNEGTRPEEFVTVVAHDLHVAGNVPTGKNDKLGAKDMRQGRTGGVEVGERIEIQNAWKRELRAGCGRSTLSDQVN